ncbi:lipoprotein, partial [Salmonella enterica subsp. enterica serovar Agona str. SH10GFN094]
RQKLVKQYQAVKLANGYYNAARDELSIHDLATAKANIDKLDDVQATHPVIKKLQKKALAMKQAIMNYEASQSTSSGSDSSTVVSSSSAASASDSRTSSSSTSSTSADSSTMTSSSNSSASASSSSSELTTSAIIKQFQDASGVTFTSDTEFNITKETSAYYQITAIYATNESSSSASKTVTDTYRYYPDSGSVTKENSATGSFE